MRELSSVEHSWYIIGRNGPVNAVRCYEVLGELTDVQMESALTALIDLSPALRCRITVRPDSPRPWFAESEGPHTAIERMEGTLSPELRKSTLESLLATSIDPHNEPMMRFLWASDGPHHHWLFLCFHHSICDAVTNLNCMRAFLALCDAHCQGQGAFDHCKQRLKADLDHFPSLCESLPKKPLVTQTRQTLGYLSKKLRDEARMKASQLRGQKPVQLHPKQSLSAPPGMPISRTHHLTLSPDFARRLRHAARTESLTVNAVFTSSLLRALKRVLFPEKRSITLNSITFVNVRSFVQPNIPHRSLGCYVSAAFGVHRIEDEWSLENIARDVAAQLDESRKSEVLEQARYADLVAKGLFHMGRHTVATLSMSNIGDVSALFQFENYTVQEIHLHSSLSALGAVLSVGLTATEEMLAVDFTFLEELLKTHEVERIGALALEDLEAFIAGPGNVISPAPGKDHIWKRADSTIEES